MSARGRLPAAATLGALAMVLCLPLAASADSSAAAGPAGTVRVYVGTYTSGESKGIYRLRLDLATGALTPEGEPAPAVNPSFLAWHPGGRFLYAVNETGESRADKSGGVSAFAVDAASGALTLLNQQPSGGPAPCHLWVDPQGRHLLVANYWDGSVSVLPIGADGRLGAATARIQHQGQGVNPQRQEGPHAHSVTLDAAGRFAFVADLGTDRLAVYRFDAAQGTLTPHQPPAAALAPGAGPRHFTFHPDGRRAYLINELHSTITAFDYDAAAGTLVERQTLPTLPAGVDVVNFTAEVAVHPGGKFLYGSNRGFDSIAAFAIDPATGKLTPESQHPTLGKWPRHFAIDPTGTFLLAANQNSDSVVVFRIDPARGRLQPVGAPVRVPRPACLRMVKLER
jgi:6-phosphogluconolactonase